MDVSSLPTKVALRDGKPVLGAVVGLAREHGRVQWVTVNAVRLRAADGSVTWVLSTLNDMTEIRHAHKEVRRSDALFSTAFSNAPIGMALVDRVHALRGVGSSAWRSGTRAPDKGPQLPLHVPVANLVRAEDDRWSALHGRAISPHGKPGAVLRSREQIQIRICEV